MLFHGKRVEGAPRSRRTPLVLFLDHCIKHPKRFYVRLYTVPAVALGLSVVSATGAKAAPCDPATDPSCIALPADVPPVPVVSTIDERQFVPLLVVITILTGVQLIMLVMHATRAYELQPRRGRR